MSEINGSTSDGYHTFDELYRYRMLYNAAFFKTLDLIDNHAWPSFLPYKSKRHSDGELCFGGGWFVVMAKLPTGQISNHYAMEYWDFFDIQEINTAYEWDGHTPEQAAERIEKWLING